MQEPVALEAACAAIAELWSPRVVGQVNNQYIKAVRIQGEFPWHTHMDEDEMFYVLRGELHIGLTGVDAQQSAIVVRPGEFFVVPRGVRHNTAASKETWLMLVETITTRHTGEEVTPLTRSIEDQLQPSFRNTASTV